MEVTHLTAAGRSIQIEPLRDEHEPLLWQIASPAIFRFMAFGPKGWGREAFAAYIHDLPRREGWWPHVILDNESERAFGVSCYMEAGSAHRGVEIGGTWFGEVHQGTQVNPESKYLLLRHAFDTLAAVRVQLKTDARNLQSQAAISKLGAVHEGVLRKHTIMPDGFIRDTVVYSIVEAEWPLVRARLEERLGYIP